MFFADKRGSVLEMLRALIPGGHLAVAVWDAIENSPVYPIEVALLERMAGTRAADALRAPFVLGERQELAALFEGAGLASATITTQTGRAQFPSVRSMVEADLRGWLAVMGVVPDEQLIERLLEEAEIALRRYVTANGQVVFDSPAHIVAGTKACDSAMRNEVSTREHR